MPATISDNPQYITIRENAPMPLGAYSHVVQAGDFVFVCGLGARNSQTGKEDGVVLDASGQVVSYDMETQTRTVLNNLITCLATVNCTLQDVVDVQVFLADMKDFPKYNPIYAEFFNFEKLPVRTTIEARPPGHNFIEVKAVAYKPR